MIRLIGLIGLTKPTDRINWFDSLGSLINLLIRVIQLARLIISIIWIIALMKPTDRIIRFHYLGSLIRLTGLIVLVDLTNPQNPISRINATNDPN